MLVEKIVGGCPVVTDEIDAGHGLAWVLARVNEGRAGGANTPGDRWRKIQANPRMPSLMNELTIAPYVAVLALIFVVLSCLLYTSPSPRD